MDGSSKTSIQRGAGAMLRTCQRPIDCIRGMARNPGQHQPDGSPPTDPTMSVHRCNKEEMKEFHQPIQVQSHLEMPGILVQLGHIQCT